MSDYTSTAGDIILGKVHLGDNFWRELSEDEVRQGIAAIEREAAARALEEAAEQIFLPSQGPAHYIDIGLSESMSADWLRARAAEIREGKSE